MIRLVNVEVIESVKTLQQLSRFEKLYKYIKEENTGTLEHLARRLGVSRSTVYEMLTYLREVGARITYSRGRETFYYEKKFQLKVSISVTVLNEEEEHIIFGGGAIPPLNKNIHLC